MEAKLFTDEEAFVSTFAFHEHRDRAPHWDQGVHRPRMEKAADFVNLAISAQQWWSASPAPCKVIDLGCGDGGLIAHLSNVYGTIATFSGYDFQPSNADGWEERQVTAQAMNFVERWAEVPLADVYIATEVLEHLTDPHMMVKKIFARGAQLVCSSPWTETFESHDACHAWAWDTDGYAAMLDAAGFIVRRHEQVGMFQVALAVPKG